MCIRDSVVADSQITLPPITKLPSPIISILLPYFNYNKITSSIININISIITLPIFSITTVSTSILLNSISLTHDNITLIQNNIFLSTTSLTLTWTDLLVPTTHSSPKNYLLLFLTIHLKSYHIKLLFSLFETVSYTHLDVYKRQE